MAEDTVNKIQSRVGKTIKACSTQKEPLFGANRPLEEVELLLNKIDLTKPVKEHLIQSYGEQSLIIASKLSQINLELLHPDHPYLWAEVEYLIENEFVERTSDLLFRRLRLGFLDEKSACEAYEKVSGLLGKVHHWTKDIFRADRLDFDKHLSLNRIVR